MNPTRSHGPVLVSGTFNDLWLYCHFHRYEPCRTIGKKEVCFSSTISRIDQDMKAISKAIKQEITWVLYTSCHVACLGIS